jgi:hypothetical protein
MSEEKMVDYGGLLYPKNMDLCNQKDCMRAQ